MGALMMYAVPKAPHRVDQLTTSEVRHLITDLEAYLAGDLSAENRKVAEASLREAREVHAAMVRTGAAPALPEECSVT